MRSGGEWAEMRTLTLARKDLIVEFRSKQLASLMLLFSLVVILAFRFALEPMLGAESGSLPNLAAAVIWISYSFAAMMGMYASFQNERENDALDGLRLCPVEGGTVFLGKSLANLMVVFVVDVATLVFFIIFFNYDLGGHVVEMLLLTLLGSSTLVLIGTLVSGIAATAEASEIVLPVLFIPLVVFSVIIPAVNATRSILSNDVSGAFNQVAFIAGAAILFTALGYLTYDYLLEG